MPSKSECLECDRELIFRNTRDLTRKKFCSRTCRSRYHGRLKDMSSMWDRSNTPEANKKKAHHGENHPKYVEDRTQLRFRGRHENSEWIKACLSRDNYKCVECGKSGTLQVHHKAPYNRFPNLRWDTQNGISLCKDCHLEIHRMSHELFGIRY